MWSLIVDPLLFPPTESVFPILILQEPSGITSSFQSTLHILIPSFS